MGERGGRRRVVEGGGKGGGLAKAERSTGSSSKGDPVTDGIKRLAELCISFGNGVRDRELNILGTIVPFVALGRHPFARFLRALLTAITFFFRQKLDTVLSLLLIRNNPDALNAASNIIENVTNSFRYHS